MNNPGILAIKKDFQCSTRGRHALESGFPPSVKLSKTTGILFPGWIESICAVVYLIHRASGILMHFQIICISPGSTPIAAPIGFEWNELRAAKLSCAEVGMIDFCPQMIIWRLSTTMGQISWQGYTQEFLLEVCYGRVLF
ncbi:unnamed protein product [Prunus brigantina]